MTLADNQLFSSTAGRGAEIRLFPRERGGLKVITIAAQSGAPILLKGLPLAYDRDAGLWTVYTQPSDAAVYTITANGTTATDGVFDLQIDGLDYTFDHDVTAAAMETALLALFIDAGKPYTVAVVATTTTLGTNDGVVTLTFSENAGAPTVQVDMSDITGNAHVLAATDAGTQITDGTAEIRSILYTMEGVQTSATEEVQAVAMVNGEAHRDDINTAALRALLGGSPSEAELDTALRSQKLREINLDIRGLTLVS
jgi:hypothetical protein